MCTHTPVYFNLSPYIHTFIKSYVYIHNNIFIYPIPSSLSQQIELTDSHLCLSVCILGQNTKHISLSNKLLSLSDTIAISQWGRPRGEIFVFIAIWSKIHESTFTKSLQAKLSEHNHEIDTATRLFERDIVDFTSIIASDFTLSPPPPHLPREQHERKVPRHYRSYHSNRAPILHLLLHQLRPA